MSSIYGPSGSIAFFSTAVSYSFDDSGSATEFFRRSQDIALTIQTDYSLGNPKGVKFLIPSESVGTAEPITALYITTSKQDLKVGFGTDDPLASLDVRSITSSAPANLILRTNEDGVIEVGEETGRIEFVIESSSFLGTNFITSGSTAAIFSRVVESSAAGAIGNLIISVNSASALSSVDAVTIGKGATPGFSGIGMAVSGNLDVSSAAPLVQVKNDNGTTLARLGYHSPTDFSDGQLLLFNQGTASVLFNGDESPADASFIKFGNLALGGTTAGERLTVEGNISASGDITGSDISITGFTSVSASLAAAGGGGGSTPTLQQVMDQGSSTTTSMTASIISVSNSIIGGNITSNGNAVISQSGVFTNNELVVAVGTSAVTSSNLITVDQSNNRVGINTASPRALLDISSQVTGETRIFFTQVDNNADSPNFRSEKARGTLGSEADVQDGDGLLSMNGFGYLGGDYRNSAQFRMEVDGTPSGTNVPTSFAMRTDNGSGITDRIVVKGDGNTQITGSVDISSTLITTAITSSGNISSSGEIFGSTGSFDIIQGGTF